MVASWVSAAVHGEDKSAGQAAFKRLMAEKRFSLRIRIGGGELPGDNGFFPKEVGSFLILLKSPQGKDFAKQLLTKAQPAGQLYGLCLLYHLDKQAFKKGCVDLKKSGKTVDYLRGDIVMRYKVSYLVHADDPATVVLENKQTIANWFEKNKPLWQPLKDFRLGRQHLTKFHQRKCVPIDIQGGAIPTILAGLKKPVRKVKGK